MRQSSQQAEYLNRRGSSMYRSARRLLASSVLGASCAVMAVGCGGGVDHEPTISVEGTITYNGEPVSAGTLMFWPSGTSKGRRATAAIESGGTFVPGTFEPGDGLVPGEYDVTVESSSGDAVAAGKTDLGATSSIPQKYSNATTTDLHVTVTSGQDQQRVTLELKD